MRRFFVDGLLSSRMVITGGDAHHICHVLRLQPGDLVTLADSAGEVGQAVLRSVAPDCVTVELMERLAVNPEPPVRVWLAQGLPKGDKMEYIVQKAVELGVSGIVPVVMEHSVVKYDEAKARTRVERWNKIAAEAAKQCRRGTIPPVEEMTTLPQVLAQDWHDAVLLLLYEGETRLGLRRVLSGPEGSRTFLLFVGPEGGFTPAEAALAHSHGARLITLGHRILRTETASLAALAAIMYECGDLGGS